MNAKRISILLLIALGFVVFSFFINRVRIEEVAVLLLKGSKSHMDYYREALYMYRKDHPHLRFKLIDVYIGDGSDVAKIVEDLKSKGIRFVVAPYRSEFVDSLAEKSKGSGLVIFAPFSMLSRPAENVVRTVPNFSDMAKTLSKHLRDSNYSKVEIFVRAQRHFDELLNRIAEVLEDTLSKHGLDYRRIERINPGSSETYPLVIVALFPSDISREMKFVKDLVKSGREVILFTSNPYNFQVFYGESIRGVKYITEKFYDERGDFVRRYEKMFGKIPMWHVAAMYDTLSMIEHALKENLKRLPEIREMKHFDGIQGSIPLNENPDMSNLLKVDEF